jgi:putative ABC transport system substrate-binding protein
MSAFDPKRTRRLKIACSRTVSMVGLKPEGQSMRRREFITLFGSAAASWPLAARAQQAALPVIGYLSGATFQTMHDWLTAFEQSLAKTGFTEGHDVAIEYRWAEGHNDRLPELAADLVRRNVAVIAVGASTPGALAAKGATQTIPIVFGIGTDPVKTGLVASLAHPGGNVTGVTAVNVELIAKRFELMHSLMPPATRIGVLVNPGNAPQTAAERTIIQNVGKVLGADFSVLTASSPDEIETLFENLVSERVGALVVSGENFFETQCNRLIDLAAGHAVPTIYAYSTFPVAGGLMSYGTDYTEPSRLQGEYVGRILKGEKPADLPVQQVTRVDLVINLKTAKTLGLAIPLPLLGRADQVIE